jgi:hypothetical protein
MEKKIGDSIKINEKLIGIEQSLKATFFDLGDD